MLLIYPCVPMDQAVDFEARTVAACWRHGFREPAGLSFSSEAARRRVERPLLPVVRAVPTGQRADLPLPERTPLETDRYET